MTHYTFTGNTLIGGATVEEVQIKKSITNKILENATFKLHKWHSNISELEMEKDVPDGQEGLSFAKQRLRTRSTETKMLGLPWNKTNDTLKVIFPHEKSEPTKRGVLSCLAKVYNPLGLASPVTLISKLIF